YGMHGKLMDGTRLRRAQVDALELVLGCRDSLLKLRNLALRLTQIFEHVSTKILIELDDLQFSLADLAACPGDIGNELPAFALQPRLIALKLRVARNGDEILMVKLGHSNELLSDQIELAFLCHDLCGKPANLLVQLGDPLAQLRALTGPRCLSRLEQP